MQLSPSTLRARCPNPVEIIKKLDEYIIGQHVAKKMLAVMLLNRALLLLSKHKMLDLPAPLEKSNVLLIGPTGSGKTALIKALEEVSGSIITCFDVSSITAAGYIGGKVEDILIRHTKNYAEYINNHKLDIYESAPDTIFANSSELTRNIIESGIIYLDEIDKMRKRGSTGGYDINGDMVQNELLKLLEGGTVDIAGRRRDERDSEALPLKTVCTNDMFFICGGAFSGLEEIIIERLNKNSNIGFTASLKKKSGDLTDETYLQYVTTEDLIQYGFKPEFLGRLPLKAALSPITKAIMMDIIIKPKQSVLAQYISMFNVFGIELVLEQSGLEVIAEFAVSLKTGARSLKTIFSTILTDELCNVFENTEKKLIVDKEFVLKRELQDGF